MNDDTKNVNLSHARTGMQKKVMEKIIKDGVCPFCRENLLTYHTKPILKETEHWVVTESFEPYKGARHHFLFISKLHCSGFWELDQEARIGLFALLDELRVEQDIPGGTFIMRWGDTEYTGGSVTHLHAQFIAGGPRKEGVEPIITFIGYQSE